MITVSLFMSGNISGNNKEDLDALTRLREENLEKLRRALDSHPGSKQYLPASVSPSSPTASSNSIETSGELSAASQEERVEECCSACRVMPPLFKKLKMDVRSVAFELDTMVGSRKRKRSVSPKRNTASGAEGNSVTEQGQGAD